MEKKGREPKEGHMEIDEDDIPLEKNDPFALVTSGYLVIALPCLLLILLTMAMVYLIFLR